MFVCLFAGSVNASIIINNSVTGNITNDFEGLTQGNVAGLINQSGADYGELFTGQSLNTTGDFDSLSGTPTASLTLEANTVLTDNIGIVSFSGTGSNVIYGDRLGVIGTGALSILLGNDTNLFGFDIVGDSGGSFLVEFFGSDGSLLGSFSQLARTSFFGFEVDRGSLIRAVSITNTDPAGIGFDNFTFNATVVPEPAIIALFGLGLASIGFSRKKKIT